MDYITSGSASNARGQHLANALPTSTIKRDELYVLSGDTLLKAYAYLYGQRVSFLSILSKMSPKDLDEFEQYLKATSEVNLIMYELLNGLPLASVLQIEMDRLHHEDEEAKRGLTLGDLLRKLHIREGDKDEGKHGSDRPSDGEQPK